MSEICVYVAPGRLLWFNKTWVIFFVQRFFFAWPWRVLSFQFLLHRSTKFFVFFLLRTLQLVHTYGTDLSYIFLLSRCPKKRHPTHDDQRRGTRIIKFVGQERNSRERKFRLLPWNRPRQYRCQVTLLRYVAAHYRPTVIAVNRGDFWEKFSGASPPQGDTKQYYSCTYVRKNSNTEYTKNISARTAAVPKYY